MGAAVVATVTVPTAGISGAGGEQIWVHASSSDPAIGAIVGPADKLAVALVRNGNGTGSAAAEFTVQGSTVS